MSKLVKRRKLESRAGEERFKYEWREFSGLIVVTVESEFSPSIGRIANSVSPKGFFPDIMILYNPAENNYTVIPNRKTVESPDALKFLRNLAGNLNRADEAAKYGGSKWVINMQEGSLQSPNHGLRSELSTAKIITIIGLNQYYQELKRMRNTIFLPLPGQVDATESMRMVLEKTPGEMPIGGKIEVVKGKAKITLGGSL